MYPSILFLLPILLLCESLESDFHISTEDFPVTKINTGELKEKYLESRENKRFSAFPGIPYAEPPKRFQISERLNNPWNGVRNSTAFGDRCIQTDLFTRQLLGTEDCLFLTVYTPNLKLNLPVIVYLHGGGFQSWSGDMYDPSFFMDEDIIFVTINYRLGAMGFLSTGDGEIEGNFGLKDQILALHWVQENIHNFGGDKSRVTIMGESAGAASVHLLVLSPMGKDLFHSAIAHSASAINDWALLEIENPGVRAGELGQKLGCSSTKTSTKDIGECLKSASALDITNQDFVKCHLDPAVPFGPTTETISKNGKNTKPFIAEHPLKILESGNFNKVPTIFTICAEEGLIQSAIVMENEKLREDLNKDWLKFAPLTLYYDHKPYNQERMNKISMKFVNSILDTKILVTKLSKI